MCPKDADGMANSVVPNQTAPLGAACSGSALFAQTYLSENLGSLRYSAKVAAHFLCWGCISLLMAIKHKARTQYDYNVILN